MRFSEHHGRKPKSFVELFPSLSGLNEIHRRLDSEIRWFEPLSHTATAALQARACL